MKGSFKLRLRFRIGFGRDSVSEGAAPWAGSAAGQSRAAAGRPVFASSFVSWRLRCLLLFALSLVFPGLGAAMEGKQIVGVVEKVRIWPGAMVFDAKIDTGADNSSINTLEYSEFERDGKKWVRFHVSDGQGRTTVMERQLVRVAQIRPRAEHGAAAPKPKRRPVVMLGICLGKIYREVEVNLADRSSFNYPVLIGRSFMGEDILVDPSKKYICEPECQGEHPLE